MADRIKTQLGIAASAKSVWETLTATTLWEKWYGVPATDAEWKEGGKITFGGEYSTTEKIKNFEEGRTFTIDGPWVDTVYTLREVPEGTYIEKLRIGKGATWIDDKVDEEVQKLQAELRKLAELVPEPEEEVKKIAEEEPELIAPPAGEVESSETSAPVASLAIESEQIKTMDSDSEWKYTESPVNPVDAVAQTNDIAQTDESGGAGKKKRRLIIIGAAVLVFAILIIVTISQFSGNTAKDSYTWGDMEFKITEVTDDLSSVNVDMKETANGKWVAATAEIENDKGIKMNQLSNILFTQEAALLDGEVAKSFSVRKIRFEVNGGIADGSLLESFVILFDMPTDYTPSVSDLYINENVDLTEVYTTSPGTYNTPTVPTAPTTPIMQTPTAPTVNY